jgi:hypothetical protein
LDIGSVFLRPLRQFDAPRLEKGRHAIVARLAVDIAPIVGVDVKGDERFAKVTGAFFENWLSTTVRLDQIG